MLRQLDGIVCALHAVMARANEHSNVMCFQWNYFAINIVWVAVAGLTAERLIATADDRVAETRNHSYRRNYNYRRKAVSFVVQLMVMKRTKRCEDEACGTTLFELYFTRNHLCTVTSISFVNAMKKKKLIERHWWCPADFFVSFGGNMYQFCRIFIGRIYVSNTSLAMSRKTSRKMWRIQSRCRMIRRNDLWSKLLLNRAINARQQINWCVKRRKLNYNSNNLLWFFLRSFLFRFQRFFFSLFCVGDKSLNWCCELKKNL